MNRKQVKSKARRGLATRRIVYVNRKHSHARHRELTVDVRSAEIIDLDYAAALVAVRASLPLTDVKIIRIEAG